MVNLPVPVAGFVSNFSPIPRIAPPPLGRLICGAANGDGVDAEAVELSMSDFEGELGSAIVTALPAWLSSDEVVCKA